ncbi:hypothetical protein AB0C21_27025 [Spirillospora sp. NPDC049024]
MHQIARQAALLAEAGSGDFHPAALVIAGHRCDLPHGAWTRLIEGCQIYQFSDQGRRAAWEANMRLWLDMPEPGAPSAEPRPPHDDRPVVPDSGPDPSQPAWGGPIPQSAPEIIEHAVHVGTYVAAAAAGGIIGNRADAATNGAVRRMFRSLRERFGRAAPVTEERAFELARAEVVRTGHAEHTITLLGIERESGCWIVHVRALHVTGAMDRMRVRVPFDAAAAPSVLVVDPRIP